MHMQLYTFLVVGFSQSQVKLKPKIAHLLYSKEDFINVKGILIQSNGPSSRDLQIILYQSKITYKPHPCTNFHNLDA